MRNFAILAAILFLLLETATFAFAEENIALGKKYTLLPKANFKFCSDDDDATQLTDGKKEDLFWVRPGGVGWAYRKTASVTIDLEKEEPISAISFHTVAGTAAIDWPSTAYVFVSPDGNTWYAADDLMTLDLEQNGARYSDHKNLRDIKGTGLNVKGRFVKIFFRPTTSFIVLDEVEIYRADESVLSKPYPGEPVQSAEETTQNLFFTNKIRWRYLQDKWTLLLKTQNAIKTADSSQKEKLTGLLEQVTSIHPDDNFCLSANPETFRTIFPYDSVHQNVFSLLASFWRIIHPDAEKLLVERLEPYAYTEPIVDLPSEKDVDRTVVLTRNEIREALYRLYNTSDHPLDVTITLGGDLTKMVGSVSCFEVPWTDTAQLVPVAAALVPIKPDGENRFSLRLLPGLTSQAWFEINSEDLEAGDYKGNVLFESEGCTVEKSLNLHISPVTLPKDRRLILGGWDYTDFDVHYNFTENNRDAFIQMISNYGVNGPWSAANLMFENLKAERNSDGTWEISFTDKAIQTWISRWPNARRYYLCYDEKDSFCGFEYNTPEFSEAVAAWAKKWGEWFESHNINPSNVSIMVFDEPGLGEKDLRVSFPAWASAIKKGEPRFQIWEDPVFKPSQTVPQALFDGCDTLCLNRPLWIADREWYEETYLPRKKDGIKFDLYSCDGPSRLLDPYSYYRLQAWQLFTLDGEASFYWAMGDGSEISSWNEYLLANKAYCPLFLSPNDPVVIPAKQLAGMRDSSFDFELLSRFRERIEIEKKAGHDTKMVEEKLADRLNDILWSEGATDYKWADQKDCTRADILRADILTQWEEWGEPF